MNIKAIVKQLFENLASLWTTTLRQRLEEKVSGVIAKSKKEANEGIDEIVADLKQQGGVSKILMELLGDDLGIVLKTTVSTILDTVEKEIKEAI